MREWTDLDYAQAAIDMLPESVEEIEVFLASHGIKSRWERFDCPIDRWVKKWTDHDVATGWTTLIVMDTDQDVYLPPAVEAYVLKVS